MYSHDSFKLIWSLLVCPKGSFRADSCYYPLEKTEVRGFGFSETKSKWMLPMDESNYVTDLSAGRGMACIQQTCGISYVCTYIQYIHEAFYIHTHARTHAHTHAHTHARTHAPTHTHTHARTHTHTHVRSIYEFNTYEYG